MRPSLTIPSLDADEIHVWIVSTHATPGEVDAIVTSLSPHEQHRAARMRQTVARHDFIAGRARVRHILGQYLQLPPQDVDVVTRIDGKPVAAGAPGWFDFSFTRCAGLHACAVARDRRIGIDIEVLGGDQDLGEVAATYAAPDEAAWIRDLPAAQQAAAVVDLWTKKEAFVKAVGTDRPLPLHGFTVPRGTSGVVAAPMSGSGGQRPWLLQAFTPVPGIAGAVVAEGTWHLTLLRYPA